MKRLLATLSVLAALTVVCSTASAVDCFVPGNSGGTPAFPTITAAIAAPGTGAGDTIWLDSTGSNTYVEAVVVNKDGLTIDGSMVSTQPAIINGAGGICVSVVAPVTNLMLRNVTLTGGLGLDISTAAIVIVDTSHIDNNAGNGIFVADSAGPLGGNVQIDLNNSSVDNNGAYGLEAVPHGTAPGSDGVTLNMNTSTMDANFSGGYAAMGNPMGTMNINMNATSSIDDHVGLTAVHFQSDMAGCNVVVNDSSISNNNRGILPDVAVTCHVNITGDGITANNTTNNWIHSNAGSTFNWTVNLSNFSADVIQRVIANNANDLDLDVTSATVTNITRQAVNIGGTAPTQIDIDLGNVTLLGNRTGNSNGLRIHSAPTMPVVNINLTTCTIRDMTGNGIQFETTETLTLVMTNTDVTSNMGSGIQINDIVSGGGALNPIMMTDCTVDNNGNYGVNVDGGLLDLTWTRGSASGNAGPGIRTTGNATNTGQTTVNLTDVTINGNAHGVWAWGGFNFWRDGNVSVTMDGGSMDNNLGGGGIGFSAVTDATVNLTNTSISGNVGTGIMPVGGVLTLTATSTDFDSNTGYGFDVGGTSSSVTLNSCSVDGSTSHGILISGGNPVMTLNNTQITNNGLDGIWCQRGGDAPLFDLNMTNNSALSNNTGNGLYMYYPDGSGDFDLVDSSFDDNGAHGMNIPAAVAGLAIDAATCTWSGNSNPGDGSGIRYAWATPVGTLITANLTDCDFIGNTLYGIGGDPQEPSLDLTMVGGVMSGHNGPAIRLDGNTVGTAVINLTSTTVENNCVAPWTWGAINAWRNPQSTVTLTGVTATNNAGGVATLSSVTTGSVVMDGCTIDQMANGVCISQTGGSSTIVDLDNTDFRTTGTNALSVPTGTLIADIDHCTFLKPAGINNPNWFLLNTLTADTVVTFDQCDFVNGGGTGATGLSVLWNQNDSFPGVIEFRDCIIGGGVYTETPETTRISQLHNLLAPGGGFVDGPGTGSGVWSDGGGTINGNPAYYTTGWGSAGYLGLMSASDALGLNSGNGSETYAGAKGGYTAPNAVGHWTLY